MSVTMSLRHFMMSVNVLFSKAQPGFRRKADLKQGLNLVLEEKICYRRVGGVVGCVVQKGHRYIEVFFYV